MQEKKNKLCSSLSMAVAMDLDNSKHPRKVIATTLWRDKPEELALNWFNQKIIVGRSPDWKLEEAFAALEIAEEAENTIAFITSRHNFTQPEKLDGSPTRHSEVAALKKELKYKMQELQKDLAKLEDLEKKIME
jgi:hypothetical protein